MANKIPAPPQPFLDALQRGIGDFVNSSDPFRERFLMAPAAGVPIFTLTLSDVADGNWAAAAPSGWRLVVGEETGSFALAEIAAGKRHPQPRMVSLSQDPRVADFSKRLQEIQQTEPFTSMQDVELRLLRIPALLVEAFWLRSPDGNDNVVVPIMAPSNVERRPFRIDEFLRVLEPLTQKFLAFDSQKP